MIHKSYLVEEKISSIKGNIFLFYGENLGLKNDLRKKIRNLNKRALIKNLDQEEILADEGEDISVLGDETKFIARINPNSTVEEGQKINLALDPTKLHYFDPDTGLAIK